MKNLIRLSVLAILLFSFTSVNSQNIKLGHTNSQELMSAMPETKTAQTELENLAKSHTERFNAMKAEYEKKYTEYVENAQLKAESPEKWDDLTLADKETELQGLQQRLTNYESLAQQKIAEKQQELLKPITDKITDAIKQVAVEGKYTYIFDVSTLLYFSTEQSFDVTPLVKKKLGLQ